MAKSGKTGLGRLGRRSLKERKAEIERKTANRKRNLAGCARERSGHV